VRKHNKGAYENAVENKTLKKQKKTPELSFELASETANGMNLTTQ